MRSRRPARRSTRTAAPPVTPTLSSRAAWIALAVVACLGLAASWSFLADAVRVNGGARSFPLDDSWIHLTYARTLHESGRFSYFPGDPTTGGSTSPLYTLLLALGFAFTRNEFTVSDALGLLFHAATLLLAGVWTWRLTRRIALAIGVMLVLALDTRIVTLSVSGMETPLFLSLLTLALLAHARGASTAAGAALGLAVWTRPDALILASVFAIDEGLPGRRAHAARAWRGLLVFAAFVAAYALFNALVGGSVFPNTFEAKQRAYAAMSRAAFLGTALRGCDLTHGWLILTPLAVVALVWEGRSLVRGDRSPVRAALGFALALPLAYLALLPFAHRFERYLVPALPAIAVAGVVGAQSLGRLLDRSRGERWLPLGALGIAVILQAMALPAARAQYADWCRYSWERQVRTGTWLRDNTPPSAVVATHDVGAIAYYSNRRIVDLAGLVSPEVIPHIRRPDYVAFLDSLLARRHASYIAVMQDWVEVVNVPPLFTADPRPEVLQVFPWVPGRSHIVPEQATALNNSASRAMRAARPADAVPILERSLALDPRSSRTWALLGTAYDMQGDLAHAGSAYRRALDLFPDDVSVRFGLARVLAGQGRTADARAELRRVLEKEPTYPGAQELLNEL